MRHRWPVVVLLVFCCARVGANPIRNIPRLDRTNRKIAGQVLDFTRNHGSDNRLWSESLGEKRDLYVYLPPNYDPKMRYPLVLWLHGFAQEEVSFLTDVIVPLDRAISCGKLPPTIIAAPDGTFKGRACFFTNSASFFINSKAGNYEDYLMKDVWTFLFERFSIRPEREAHVIAGVSMGGGSAYNTAFKYPERFKVVLGIYPPVNTRWENCKGRYRANFDPEDWNFRTNFNKRLEPVARFRAVFVIRLGTILKPLYGKDTDIADLVAAENPLELMVGRNIKDGQFSMMIAYAGRDEFNIDAQVESFLFTAEQRGINIHTAYDPKGHHDRKTALAFLPGILDWLEPQFTQYRIPAP